MTGASMANGTAPKAPARVAREIPHTVSPGLWALAWKRLKSDNVGMVSLVIVAAFILLMIASATGLIAGDWAKETGVNYAPPSFIGADIEGGAPAAPATPSGASAPAVEFKSEVVDPLADVLAEIRGEKKPAGAAVAPPPADTGKSVDPLADVMADIRKDAKSAPADVVQARAPTLPFGGDKWGRDVLKKTIKGSETSIFVGLAAAAVATLIGTVFGALAGLLREVGRRPLQLVLQRVQLDSVPAAHSRGGRGAAAEGNSDDHPDPRSHRVDRHLPADPRRVPEAQGARVRAGGRRDRRVEFAPHVRSHLSPT
jgi:peptide/nickel transport system permease protein